MKVQALENWILIAPLEAGLNSGIFKTYKGDNRYG
jgi:hypothetical protein